MDAVTNTRMQTPVSSAPPSGGSATQQAAAIRRQARGILNSRSGGVSHRLTLALSAVLILTAAIALYAAVACLAMAGYILFENTAAVDLVADILLALLGFGLILPLMVSLRRLTALRAAPDGAAAGQSPLPEATLAELFYPFTSFRAYGRTMAVACEGLGFLLLGLGIPILGLHLSYMALSATALPAPLQWLILAAEGILGLGWGFLVFFLSGKRFGWSYFVFLREELSLSDAYRLFGSLQRPLLPVLCLRLSLLGWVGLSILGLGVPFVLHTLPYALCCSAAYSRSLAPRA